MRDIRKKLAQLTVIASILCAVPSLSFADAKQFIPKLVEYTWEFEAYFQSESDETRTNGNSSKLSDTFATEMLKLNTIGFVYHPYFISFSLQVSGGLRQSTFEGFGGQSSPWQVGTAEEYDLHAYVLPTHPYNLEIFSSRKNPLLVGARSLQQGATPVTYTNGAIFTYQYKTLNTSLRYARITAKTGLTDTDSQSYGAAVSYAISGVSAGASYNHSDTSSALFGTSSVDSAYFNSTADFRRVRLDSLLNLTTSDQSQPTFAGPTSIILDNFLWREDLSLELPWNFSSKISYNLYSYKTRQESPTSTETESSNTTGTSTFSLTHRLYKSLYTSYTLSYVSSDSPQGESHQLSNTVTLSYTKMIPTGNLALGGILARSTSEQKGILSAINEGHIANIGGSFTLNGQGVDEATIIVKVLTVVPQGETPSQVELQRNINYIITAQGNTSLITITSVPPAVCQIVECQNPFFGFSFQVTYSLLSNNSKFVVTTYGYNIRLNLFNGLISPYHSYTRTQQEVTSGILPGGPADTSIITAGVALYKKPFRFIGEYQNSTSNINPYTTWRAQLFYSQNITRTANLDATAQYTRTNYPLGVVNPQTIGYSERLIYANLTLQKSFPDQRLNISFGSTYSQANSVTNTKAYSLTSGLTWKWGKIEVLGSASASLSDAESALGKNERIHQLYVLHIKRQLY